MKQILKQLLARFKRGAGTQQLVVSSCCDNRCGRVYVRFENAPHGVSVAPADPALRQGLVVSASDLVDLKLRSFEASQLPSVDRLPSRELAVLLIRSGGQE